MSCWSHIDLLCMDVRVMLGRWATFFQNWFRDCHIGSLMRHGGKILYCSTGGASYIVQKIIKCTLNPRLSCKYYFNIYGYEGTGETNF